tara:strand:+ start:425 stop:1057 length:633 start_codon:yes stop_codon:yes gene_type:complete
MAFQTLDSFFKPQSNALPKQEIAEPVVKPKAPQPTDDDQKFIDFFVSKAVSPLVRGQPLKGRKIAIFGCPHGRKVVSALPFSQLPPEFRKWCVSRKYTGFNSLTAEVLEPGFQFQWSLENVENLSKGEVVFISFAIEANARSKNLAEVKFRWFNKKDPTKKKTGVASIGHQTVLRFNARKHKKKKCENRQVALLHWLRLTLRTVKVEKPR